MQRNLARPIRMSALADQANLSASRFRQIFVAQTGTAPAEFLLRLRMRRARLLIERTFLSVKEIMALVGYNDPSHFTRDFRRAHGGPPTAFRESGAVLPMPIAPDRRAVAADTPESANRPTHRRIGQVKAREARKRCA